jgi:hypothetical protein
LTIELARKQLYFLSAKRPHEIQDWLERNLSAVLSPVAGEARATFQTSYKWAGIQFQIRLVYEAAFPNEDAYTFYMHCDLSEAPKDLPAYQRSADSWFSVWTREWKAPTKQSNAKSSEDLYATRTAEWLRVHESLQDPVQLQAMILDGMRQGATFSTAHKEGGTVIRYIENRWVRSDYGESDAYEIFRTPESFLAFLRQFYDFETSRNNWPNKVPEATAWRLIYRHLRPDKSAT